MVPKALCAAAAVAAISFAAFDPSAVALAQDSVVAHQSPTGLKRRVAVGRFTNSTAYGRLLLGPGEPDPIAVQASDMLSNALVASDHFIVFERSDLAALDFEREIAGASSQLSGVDVVLLGSITQLGRRNEGKQGFLNSQRRQAVNATVEIRLVDVRTGQVFFTASGAGEATSEVGEVAGFGTSAGYDSTLNDRAVSAAIADTMTNVMAQLQQRPWFTDILRVSGNQVFLSGGPSQGLAVGDALAVEQMGDVVVSRQTGLPITLPGTPVGRLEIVSFFGDTPDSEGAVARITDGAVPSDTSSLRVTEIR